MKVFRTHSGPFPERPHYDGAEVDRLCADELQATGLYPTDPGPVRVERFIEKRFEVTALYDDLPDDLLGYTRFGPQGVEEIVISRSLEEAGDSVSARILTSTLAHEVGHGLLHAHLFAPGNKTRSLFGDGTDPTGTKILCRGKNVADIPLSGRRRYDGRWWEFQANMVIGALLLPVRLVEQVAKEFLVEQGSMGRLTLPEDQREEAARFLAQQFDVNPAVARIRIEGMYPAEGSQLTL